jgi:threonine synthase
MKYISTRGGAAPQAFSDILLGGLAPDGGLYLPESYPQVTPAELAEWRELPYFALALRILEKFIDDMTSCELKPLVDRAYTAHNFRHARPGRDASDIVPLTTLEPGFHLLELSNGPTLAFKDMAMQLLGNLFEHVLAKRGETINILGATSGDTGSAAEYAMRGKQGVRVFMLSPHGLMSPFQRAQMYSLQDENIINIAIKGMFDDCQDIVKAVGNDLAFKRAHRIGTVNSINWARLVAQVVYYVAGWLQATTRDDEAVDFAVPSGNFGNICAGHIARCMGLPIGRLVCATNENDVLDEFFRSGRYAPRGAAETHETSSPSMDISKASNFERFVFDLLGRDGARVKALFTRPEFTLAPAEFARVAEFGFVSRRSSHAERIDAIRDCAARTGIVVDPHTADGLNAARPLQLAGVPMIVLETALPAKFARTIREALGRDPERPPGFDGIEDLPKRFTALPADALAVRRYIEAHDHA